MIFLGDPEIYSLAHTRLATCETWGYLNYANSSNNEHGRGGGGAWGEHLALVR